MNTNMDLPFSLKLTFLNDMLWIRKALCIAVKYTRFIFFQTVLQHETLLNKIIICQLYFQ